LGLEPVAVRLQNAGRAPAHAEIALHGAPKRQRRQAGRANADGRWLERDGRVHIRRGAAEIDHDDIGRRHCVGAFSQQPHRPKHGLGCRHDDDLVELLGAAQARVANHMADNSSWIAALAGSISSRPMAGSTLATTVTRAHGATVRPLHRRDEEARGGARAGEA